MPNGFAADYESIRRVELAEAEFQAGFVPTCERLGSSFPHTGATLLRTAAVDKGQDDLWSRVYAPGFDGEITASELDEAEAWFANLGKPAKVDLSPICDRSLHELCFERGYRIAHSDSVFLAQPEPREPVDGVSVRIADEPVVWAEVAGTAFCAGGPPEDLHAGMNEKLSILAQQPGVTPVTAYIGGQPAGGALLVVMGGVALLHAGATVPEYRRRGVQAALIRGRVAMAKDAGCEIVCAQTDPRNLASARNVLRAGFELAIVRPSVVAPGDS
ncbi:MAG: GNAT family N-acetyltransferase [Planctomycetota bacterium]